MKVEVSLNKAKWVVEPGCIILVTTADKKRKKNIITLSWQTPVRSNNPCLVAIVMRPTRFSYQLIMDTKEFAVNVPHAGLLKQVVWCGNVSGKNVDKFKGSGLTSLPAKFIKPPLIKECIGHLECYLKQTCSIDDHVMIIGEVIRALVESKLFDGHWIPHKAKTLHYLGDKFYGVLEKRTESP